MEEKNEKRQQPKNNKTTTTEKHVPYNVEPSSDNSTLFFSDRNTLVWLEARPHSQRLPAGSPFSSRERSRNKALPLSPPFHRKGVGVFISYLLLHSSLKLKAIGFSLEQGTWVYTSFIDIHLQNHYRSKVFVSLAPFSGSVSQCSLPEIRVNASVLKQDQGHFHVITIKHVLLL